MSEEPRPCMKCGSSDIEVVYSNRAFCRCRKCGTKGKEYPTGNEQFAEYIDREAAIKDWNTRPTEDALTARLEEAERVMGEIDEMLMNPKNRGRKSLIQNCEFLDEIHYKIRAWKDEA